MIALRMDEKTRAAFTRLKFFVEDRKPEPAAKLPYYTPEDLKLLVTWADSLLSPEFIIPPTRDQLIAMQAAGDAWVAGKYGDMFNQYVEPQTAEGLEHSLAMLRTMFTAAMSVEVRK